MFRANRIRLPGSLCDGTHGAGRGAGFLPAGQYAGSPARRRPRHRCRSARRQSENPAGALPTLFRDPEQIRIFKAQCDYPGALFSLDFHGGRHAAFTFLRNLRIARNAVSLGGVETLACHPKTTTHSGMSPRELEEAGIGNGLVRVSASIEDWRDLLADFEQALDTIG